MAELLPFAVEAKRARGSQSWTCLCQRRRRQAWNGLSLIAIGVEGPGERIPVLRFPRFLRQAGEGRGVRGPQFLSDNPNPGNRVESVSKAISKYPKKNYRKDSPEFEQIRSEVAKMKPL